MQCIILESRASDLPEVVDLKRDDRVCWLRLESHVVGAIHQTCIKHNKSCALDAAYPVFKLEYSVIDVIQ
jgi:hypothetical protein